MYSSIDGFGGKLVQQDQQIIPPEEVEVKCQEVAGKSFENYPKLLELKTTYLKKLSDLKTQKIVLDKSWIVFFYRRDPEGGMPRNMLASMIGGSFTSILGAGLTSLGFRLHDYATGIGGVTLISVGICASIFFTLYRSENMIEQVQEFCAVKQKICIVEQQLKDVTRWIKLTHIFENFNIEWCKYSKVENDTNPRRIFKTLSNILIADEDDIAQIDGGNFKDVALMFLMEKVCGLHPNSELAKSWNELLTHPADWGDKEAVKVWHFVGLNKPAEESYIPFHKSKKFNYTNPDKFNYIDPDNWCSWLDSKIKNDIDQKLAKI